MEDKQIVDELNRINTQLQAVEISMGGMKRAMTYASSSLKRFKDALERNGKNVPSEVGTAINYLAPYITKTVADPEPDNPEKGTW